MNSNELDRMLNSVAEMTQRTEAKMAHARILELIKNCFDEFEKCCLARKEGIQLKKEGRFLDAKRTFLKMVPMCISISEKLEIVAEETQKYMDDISVEDLTKIVNWRKGLIKDIDEETLSAFDQLYDVCADLDDIEQKRHYAMLGLEGYRRCDNPTAYMSFLGGCFCWRLVNNDFTQEPKRILQEMFEYYERAIQQGKQQRDTNDLVAYQVSCHWLGMIHLSNKYNLRDDEKSYRYFCMANDSGLDSTAQLVKYKKTLFGKIKYIG